MAISLSLEASEVLEHFQWKTTAEVEAEELGDVLNWVLLMSHDLKVESYGLRVH